MFFRRFLIVLATFAISAGAFAQKNQKETKKWEESTSRMIEPEVRTFVAPTICDMKMLSTSREIYGPYAIDVRMFYAKSFDDLTNSQLSNIQNNAVYLAAKESDADAIIEPMFHSWVLDGDDKTIYVELSGYPVSYINFRPATKADIEMIGVVYPIGAHSLTIDASDNTPNSSTTTK